MKKLELLSPAGDMEKLKAALIGGADAVYLAGKNFGARKSAGNFTNEEMIEAIHFAHLRDRKVFVTVNILFYDDELSEVYKYIQFLNNADVDGILVQDIGLIDFSQSNFKDLEIHASTQMGIHSSYGARWAKTMGFDRIVMARESTLDQVKEASKIIDTEIFIHGAHCISYSGQCLMSSLIGGRSGNRGECAQPCRKTYQLIDANGNVNKSIDGEYLLSPKDMFTLDHIEEIKNSGAMSLKIEGRMKNKYYAYATAHEYRQRLLNEVITYSSAVIFNREYTPGRLFKMNDDEFMNSRSPENHGVVIGKIVSHRDKIVTIDADRELSKGDELKIFRGSKSVGGRIESVVSKTVYRINSKMEFKKDEIIHLTYDTEMVKRIDEELNNEKRVIPLDINVIITKTDGMAVTMKCQGIKIRVEKLEGVESAKSSGLTKEAVEKQLDKLGDTVYYLNRFSADIQDNIFVKKSDLNSLRREAIELMDAKRNERYENKKVDDLEIVIPEENDSNDPPQLSIEVSNMEQLKTVDLDIFNIIYYADFESLKEAYEYHKEIIPVLPEVSKDHEILEIETLLNQLEGVETIMVRTIGQFEYFRENYKIETDFSFNITNQASANALMKSGVERVTLSEELSKDQLSDISRHSGVDTAMTIYGYQRAMITDYCIYRSINQCHHCTLTGSYLRDQKDFEFPLMKAYGCRTKILNSHRLNLAEFIVDLKTLSIGQLRLRFTIEDAFEVKKITQKFHEAFHENKNIAFEGSQNTTGYFLKGVIR